MTLCNISHQAPLFMEFFRQEYWSRLPFPSPGDLSMPRIEPSLQADSLPSEPPGKPKEIVMAHQRDTEVSLERLPLAKSGAN